MRRIKSKPPAPIERMRRRRDLHNLGTNERKSRRGEVRCGFSDNESPYPLSAYRGAMLLTPGIPECEVWPAGNSRNRSHPSGTGPQDFGASQSGVGSQPCGGGGQFGGALKTTEGPTGAQLSSDFTSAVSAETRPDRLGDRSRVRGNSPTSVSKDGGDLSLVGSTPKEHIDE